MKTPKTIPRNDNKMPLTTLTQWAKGTTLTGWDSIIDEIDKNRPSGAKPNSVKVISRRIV